MTDYRLIHHLSNKIDCSKIRNVLSFTRIAKMSQPVYNLFTNFIPNEMVSHINSFITEDVIACSTENDGIILINAETGDIIERIPTLPDQIKQTIFVTDNGKFLVYSGYTDYEVGDEIDESGIPKANNNLLLLWNLETNQSVLRLTEHKVTSISFSSNNKVLIFAVNYKDKFTIDTSDERSNSIFVFDIENKMIIAEKILNQPRKIIDHVAFSVTKRTVAFSYEMTTKIFLWDLNNDSIIENDLIGYYTQFNNAPIRFLHNFYTKQLKFIKIDKNELLFCETASLVTYFNIDERVVQFSKVFNNTSDRIVPHKTNIYDSNTFHLSVKYLSIDITIWSHVLKGPDITVSHAKELGLSFSMITLSPDNKSIVLLDYDNNYHVFKIQT